MKKLTYLVLAFCFLTATSCIDIVEEMHLKKNGSGKYVITMDMSSLMEAGTKEMLQGMMDEAKEEGEADLEMPSEMDTIMYFNEAPDSIKRKFSHPEILKKVYVHTVMSEAKEKMILKFAINFDDMKEIDYFLEDLDKLQGDNSLTSGLAGSGGGSGAGGGGLLPTHSAKGMFKLAKRKFTRMATDQSTAAMSEEELQMAKMFFADASYKTIYHFPGKIKKTSMKNANIDGKTLTMVTPLIDILEGKAALEGDVCFKRR